MSILSFLSGCKSPDKSEVFKTKEGVAWYLDEAIPGSDEKSFEALDAHYAKDKNHVWYCDTYRSSQDYFSTKRKQIIVIEKANTATFNLLKNGYATDNESIFFEGVLFPVKDIHTFEILDYSFAKDLISGYYMQKEIPGSEGSSFTGLDNHYSKDSKHIYYSDIEPPTTIVSAIVENADLPSFVLLDNFSDSADAKDKNAFYAKGKKIKSN